MMELLVTFNPIWIYVIRPQSGLSMLGKCLSFIFWPQSGSQPNVGPYVVVLLDQLNRRRTGCISNSY